jgi:hypothetical protein
MIIYITAKTSRNVDDTKLNVWCSRNRNNNVTARYVQKAVSDRFLSSSLTSFFFNKRTENIQHIFFLFSRSFLFIYTHDDVRVVQYSCISMIII